MCFCLSIFFCHLIILNSFFFIIFHRLFLRAFIIYLLFIKYLLTFLFLFFCDIDDNEVALQSLGLNISRYRESPLDPFRLLVKVNLAVPSFLLEIIYYPTHSKW